MINAENGSESWHKLQKKLLYQILSLSAALTLSSHSEPTKNITTVAQTSALVVEAVYRAYFIVTKLTKDAWLSQCHRFLIIDDTLSYTGWLLHLRKNNRKNKCTSRSKCRAHRKWSDLSEWMRVRHMHIRSERSCLLVL